MTFKGKLFVSVGFALYSKRLQFTGTHIMVPKSGNNFLFPHADRDRYRISDRKKYSIRLLEKDERTNHKLKYEVTYDGNDAHDCKVLLSVGWINGIKLRSLHSIGWWFENNRIEKVIFLLIGAVIGWIGRWLFD